jgi:hypothetical protein
LTDASKLQNEREETEKRKKHMYDLQSVKIITSFSPLFLENEWLTLLDSWYEGYSIFTPSTKNSLEATNKVIKDEHTFRERHPLARFLTIANDIVSKWSISRNQDQTDPMVFSTEPTITLKKWTDSYHFAKSSKSVLQIPSKKKHLTDYYIPAGTIETVTKTDIQKYNKKKWISCDQFKDLQCGIWKLTLPNNGLEWTKGICNCPNFFKEYICKHAIGTGIRLKFCKPPPAAKDIPLGEKRKGGRPRKITKALVID